MTDDKLVIAGVNSTPGSGSEPEIQGLCGDEEGNRGLSTDVVTVSVRQVNIIDGARKPARLYRSQEI
jgi:hypothetical protein